MRRFELVRGLTRRFWHVLVEGSQVTVTTGIAGTPSQPLTAVFPSPEAAMAEQERLIKERLSWGYVELTPAPSLNAPPPDQDQDQEDLASSPPPPASPASIPVAAPPAMPAPDLRPDRAERAARAAAARRPSGSRPRRTGPSKRLLALPPQALALTVADTGNKRTRRDAMMALAAQSTEETPRWVAASLTDVDAVIRAIAEEYFARSPRLIEIAAAGQPPLAAGPAARLQQLRAELAPPDREVQLRDLPPGLTEGARAIEAGSFWSAAALARPELMGNGAAVPQEAILALLELLRTAPDNRASFVRWRQTCTPSSLESFTWSLIRSFLAAGSPQDGSWAFRALVAFGADRTCERLVDLAMHFNEDGAKDHARTVMAALGELASDAALASLYRLESRLGRGGLAAETRQALADAARRRGLDPESLADRLVDPLGLGPDGTRVLGDGRSALRVKLDNTLHLVLLDAQDRPLSRYPKDVGGEEIWTALKSAATRLVSEQIRRMELAMASRRRWAKSDFLVGIAAHPVLRAIARGLVWATGDPARSTLFSLDASGAPVDDQGAATRIPDDGSIWLVHPLQVGDRLRTNWQAAFAAAGRSQPFHQLDRPVFQLAPEEARACSSSRLSGRTVTSARLANLLRRGWKLGPSDAASEAVRTLRKPVGNSVASLFMSPGLLGRTLVGAPSQVLGELSWVEAGPLGAVEASELILDLRTLDDAAPSPPQLQ